ncbi:MAG: four helix bundle protein [Planctomycetia bacterium]|nr:four helix bundle protein [Planctomycetia bacterium]
MVKNYKDLLVWKKSMTLVTNVYKIVEKLPSEEKYGLKSQIRRSAVSIPSNIAEGHSRWYRKEFLHHLSISYGSIAELETQLLIAAELRFIKQDEVQSIFEKTTEIGKMINGLRKKLKTTNPDH